MHVRRALRGDRTSTRLRALAHDSEHIRFRHNRAQLLVEYLYARMPNIVSCCNSSKIGDCEAAGGLVKGDHLSLGELARGSPDEGCTFRRKFRIVRRFIVRHAVHERVAAHAHEEIRVTEPLHPFRHAGHSPERYLGIERVYKAAFEPARRRCEKTARTIRLTCAHFDSMGCCEVTASR